MRTCKANERLALDPESSEVAGACGPEPIRRKMGFLELDAARFSDGGAPDASSSSIANNFCSGLGRALACSSAIT